MGEYAVGAYLKLILKCDVVDYGVRPPGGGMAGLSELDVIGLRFSDMHAYLCEVTTHLDGTLYGNGAADSIARIARKHDTQMWYADTYLADFREPEFMFWAPCVPVGRITTGLQAIATLDLVINDRYAAAIDELRSLARATKATTGNPFFRSLQILGHLRRPSPPPSS